MTAAPREVEWAEHCERLRKAAAAADREAERPSAPEVQAHRRGKADGLRLALFYAEEHLRRPAAPRKRTVPVPGHAQLSYQGTPLWEAPAVRARCRCGWFGPWRDRQYEAAEDYPEHREGARHGQQAS